MIKRTTQLADSVLALLDKYAIDDKDSFYAEPYKNGRERGWGISNVSSMTLDSRMVVFSEHRNTDALVVYYGYSSNFSSQGNLPSEKVYDNRVFFNQNELIDAVEFIFSYLKEGKVKNGE